MLSSIFFLNYTLYQNINNKILFSKFTDFFRKATPELNFTSEHLACLKNKIEEGNQKIKIAFISEFLSQNHSVTRDRSGIIRNLSRDIYDIYIISFNEVNHEIDLVKCLWDSIPKENRIILKKYDVIKSQEFISSLKLDILIYCEIGMSLDSYFLSFSRLAPIQCNTWGHSDTSGIDSIDYYISSKLYEKNYDLFSFEFFSTELWKKRFARASSK